jgi:trans-aconitate methyltransferase
MKRIALMWALIASTLSALEISETTAEFIKRLNIQETSTVLDVGCGDGKISAAIARAYPHGEIIGIDLSPAVIDSANSAFANYSNLHFAVQDAAKIHFNDQFDLIFSVSVMQWIFDQKLALHCMKQALKPGGRLCIQMPTGLPLALEQALYTTIASEKWGAYFTEFRAPWKFYQEAEYLELLGEANLTPIRLEIFTEQELFLTKAAFQEFLKQWLPHLKALPADLEDLFLSELVDHYLQILPADELGQIRFIVTRMETETKESFNVEFSY